MARITDPLIELLAIKLYEHDIGNLWPVGHGYGSIPWMKCSEEDRETYRRIARGEADLPEPEDD